MQHVTLRVSVLAPGMGATVRGVQQGAGIVRVVMGTAATRSLMCLTFY